MANTSIANRCWLPDLPVIITLLDQKILRSRVLCPDDVMKIAFKIVKSFRARSFQRGQFRDLLEETKAENEDLLFCTNVMAEP